MVRAIQMSLAVLALTVTAGCRTDDSGGSGGGLVPFASLSNQPIPDDGPLAIQFQVTSGVRLRITVTGSLATAPDFQLVVGAYQSQDFGAVPPGDIAVDSASDRRAGSAEDTFDTVIQGTYTLFVTDENSVLDALFTIRVS